MNSVIERAVNRVQKTILVDFSTVTVESAVRAVIDELLTTEDVSQAECRLPLKEKVALFVDYVFGGEHHLKSLREKSSYFELIPHGTLATYDGAELTRIVMASHRYCIRAEVQNNGMQGLKILLHNRTVRSGKLWERHPTIEAMIKSSQLSPWT